MQRPFYLIAACLCLFLAGCGANTSQSAPVQSTPIINTPVPAPAAPTPVAPTFAAPTPVAPTPAATAPAATAPAAPVDLSALQLELAPVIDGFTRPTYVTSAGDGSARLFVVEQPGVIWSVRDGRRAERPFLDIRDLVGSTGNEQGLLSLAFHPDYAANGLFFVNYTNRQGHTVVARYRVSADPEAADAASATPILTIEQPAANHNGGLLKFGPDGYLYIGTGDGGRAGDPWNNAQNRDTLLGKLLRIDVNSSAPYTVPADNPLVGENGARPEIWAYGLRNPWRFSFDRVTGDLYIADVGQNALEEVHFQPAASPGGENYGWNIMEGDICYPRNANCDPAGLELPVAVYGRDGGCSITGGYVYRGGAFPAMAGVYFYADYCSGNVWGMQQAGGEWRSELLLRSNANISSFGEDEAGELYLTDLARGVVYRLVME